jgi:hypothetical protein
MVASVRLGIVAIEKDGKDCREALRTDNEKNWQLKEQEDRKPTEDNTNSEYPLCTCSDLQVQQTILQPPNNTHCRVAQ